MCENIVVKYVPQTYSYRKVKYQCGSTGIDGNPVWCHTCENSDRVRRIMDDSDADNAWLRSANWGEM